MAVYNLSQPLDKQRFKRRVNYMYEHQAFVELTERKPQRTSPQNRYLHLLLQYFALLTDKTLDYVKEQYYKRVCNADYFVVRQYDDIEGCETEFTRSSRDLSTEEMSITIDRFKNWASLHGFYLPDAEHEEEIIQAQQEIEYHKRYINLE